MDKDNIVKKFKRMFPVMNVIVDEGERTSKYQWGSRVVDNIEILYESGISNIIIRKFKTID